MDHNCLPTEQSVICKPWFSSVLQFFTIAWDLQVAAINAT